MTRGMLTVSALLGLAASASAQDSTAAIPELGARVTRVRFFEGPRTMPGVVDRKYAARFDSGSTRSIYVELGLSYPPAPRAISFGIECGFTAPGGASAGIARVEVQTDAGWELSVHAGGTGTDTPGGWLAGTYPVECRHAGKVIASGSFEIARPAAAAPSSSPARNSTARAAPPAPPPGPRANPNAKAPATLSGIAVGALKARVTGVRFFESGSDLPDRNERVLSTTFDALTTRYINIELDLEYPRASRSTGFEIPCRFDGPDSAVRTPTVKGTVDPGWSGSFHTSGWGAPSRGVWPAGTYKVTCTGDGKVVVASEFTVAKAGAAVEALGASLTHLRFFHSLGERSPVETRRYGTRFDGRTARWIKAEFGLVYPAVAAPVTFVIDCTYTFPDGSTRAARVERQVPAGWTGSVHAQGIGSDRPGWPAGWYRVSCASGGRSFAAGSFEVTATDPEPVSGGTLRVTGRHQGSELSGPVFDVKGFDTLLVEASLPQRAATDSSVFRCGVIDPSGAATAFSIDGEVRDRSVQGSAVLTAADPPRLRGTYRIQCRIGTRVVLGERFEITGAPDLPAADARVVSSALFEGAETAPEDEAIADVTWSAGRVRSLWLVAMLDRPTEKGGSSFGYSCRLTNARNTPVADTGPRSVELAPDDRVIVVRQRLGLLPRQRWTAGRFTLTCVSGGVTFVRTTVDLTR